jgi:hypothetical protein
MGKSEWGSRNAEGGMGKSECLDLEFEISDFGFLKGVLII